MSHCALGIRHLLLGVEPMICYMTKIEKEEHISESRRCCREVG